MTTSPGIEPSGIVTSDAAPISASAIERALLRNMARGELVLVRHGHQAYPPDATTRGELIDPPLSPVGRAQAELVARYLQHDGISAVYCSELSRARDTAEVLAAAVGGGVAATVVDGLLEIDIYGELDEDHPVIELVPEDVATRAAEAFLRTRRWESFPHTETGAALRRRVRAAIEGVARAHEHEVIAVVAHGAVINGFLAEVLGVAEDMFFFPAHASVSRVLFHGDQWVVVSLNELSHLQAVGDPAVITY